MAGRIPARGFLRRAPVQARSWRLVDAVVVAFDQLLRTSADERDVTIESVLHRAGVGIGSFYEYFTNRDSLVGALVERATRDNFDALLATLDTPPPNSLDEAIDRLATGVVATYLHHRLRTRVLISGIGRFGLLPVVNAERDRFAERLAEKLRRFRPALSPEAARAAMREFCDAAIGVLVGELYRPPRPDGEIATQLARLGRALLVDRSEATSTIPE